MSVPEAQRIRATYLTDSHSLRMDGIPWRNAGSILSEYSKNMSDEDDEEMNNVLTSYQQSGHAWETQRKQSRDPGKNFNKYQLRKDERNTDRVRHIPRCPKCRGYGKETGYVCWQYPYQVPGLKTRQKRGLWRPKSHAHRHLKSVLRSCLTILMTNVTQGFILWNETHAFHTQPWSLV